MKLYCHFTPSVLKTRIIDPIGTFVKKAEPEMHFHSHFACITEKKKKKKKKKKQALKYNFVFHSHWLGKHVI